MRCALQHRCGNVADEQAADSRSQVHARVKHAPLQVQPAKHARAHDGGGVFKRIEVGRDAGEQQRRGAKRADGGGNVARHRGFHEGGFAAGDEAEGHHGQR